MINSSDIRVIVNHEPDLKLMAKALDELYRIVKANKETKEIKKAG